MTLAYPNTLGPHSAGISEIFGYVKVACIPPMTYFKGTDRAIYAVYTQRLGQYVHCGHYRAAQLAVSNTRQYLHRSLRDTNQLINTPLPGLYGVFWPVATLLLRYTRYCICDTVPPCRVHVHSFTIIQFLRARTNFIQFLRAYIFP